MNEDYGFQLAEDIAKMKVDGKALARYGYAYEFKYDGERVMAILLGNGLFKLKNRRGADITDKFPCLHADLRALAEKQSLVLDCEVIVLDQGRDNFGKLQGLAHTQNREKIDKLNVELDIVLMVFDVIEKNNVYLGGVKYQERHEKLFEFAQGRIKIVEKYSEADYDVIWEKAQEGIMAKRLNSIYNHKRNTDWLKIKKFKEKKIIFTAYEIHSNDAGITLTNELGDRVSCGSEELSLKIRADLAKYGKVKVEVQYLEMTEDGRMRFPSFKRMVEFYEK